MSRLLSQLWKGANCWWPSIPPPGKLLMALGIGAFGDNQWGWRIPSVLFGVALVVVFYYLCRELVGRSAAFIAVWLLAFETLVFTFSGLAMLVVFSATFMCLAFLSYLRGRYVLAGVFLCSSGLSRLTGLLGALAILVRWMVVKRKVEPPRTIAIVVASSVVALLAAMPLLNFTPSGEWQSP